MILLSFHIAKHYGRLTKNPVPISSKTLTERSIFQAKCDCNMVILDVQKVLIVNDREKAYCRSDVM